MYLHKEKGQQLATTLGLQLPIVLHDLANLSVNYKTNVDLSQYAMKNKITELTEKLEQNFGKNTIDKLIADDKLAIMSLEQAKQSYDMDIPSKADGFYLDGKAVLIADNLTQHSVSATFLHELGGHGGFQTLLPKNTYQDYIKRFNTLVAENDPLAVQAHQLAHQNSPNHAEDEYIPYLITLARESKEKSPKVNQFIKDMLSHTKLFINEKFGVDIKLNVNDFEVLAKKQIDEIAHQNSLDIKKKIQAQFSQQTPSSEIELVKMQYQNTNQWLKAPNGEPTNLTEKQWLQVRTPSFKAWFGDWEHDPSNASKVLDNNGEPMVVYHHTDQAFTTFDMNKARQNMDIPAMFFSANVENSLDYGEHQIQAFLNIRNITEKPYLSGQNGNDVKDELIKQGYDGTMVDDSYDDYVDIEYAVFNPNQIKSATDNIGTFDKHNNDIRFSFTREPKERDYIYAPYEDKDKVKALGAKYDPDVKMWYVPDGVDKAKFSQWTTKPQAEYASPEYEFKKFLQSFGADIPAGHPIADGRWHSLHIQGDRSGSKKAGYIANEENGVWRGSFNNFKTGQTAYFSSKTYAQSFTPPEEIERIQRQRAEAQAKLYAHTAQSAQKILAAAQPATDHPYLTKKGVQAHGLYIVPNPEAAVQDGNIKIARDWREAKSMREHFKENGDRVSVLTAGDLMIPAYDRDGNVTTIQTIGRDKNSFKSFLTDGQKAGSFLILGEPKNNESILIAEGYATAATLYEQLGKPVVVAFDAGNLKNVALTIREKYPDSVLYMAADNDHKTALKRVAEGYTTHLNTGIEKATETAVAVGGYVVAVPKYLLKPT